MKFGFCWVFVISMFVCIWGLLYYGICCCCYFILCNNIIFNFNCVWIFRYFYSVVVEERGYGLGDIWGGDVL